MEIASGWHIGDSCNSLEEETFGDQIMFDFLRSKLHLSFEERYFILKNLSSLIHVNFSIFSLNS